MDISNKLRTNLSNYGIYFFITQFLCYIFYALALFADLKLSLPPFLSNDQIKNISALVPTFLILLVPLVCAWVILMRRFGTYEKGIVVNNAKRNLFTFSGALFSSVVGFQFSNMFSSSATLLLALVVVIVSWTLLIKIVFEYAQSI